jgi:hypothetical protein
MKYKLYVSTRRPKEIHNEILNLIDEDIEIFLNNQLIFQECDIIFLCIQPHQLDLLMKEVSEVIFDRIEKAKKKSSKIFPTIISFLSGTTIDRLKLFFPEEVNVQRTFIDYQILENYKKIYHNKITPSLPNNLIDKKHAIAVDDDELNILNITYAEESLTHLFKLNESHFIQLLIFSFSKCFVYNSKIKLDNTYVHILSYYQQILITIFGDNGYETFNKHFDTQLNHFKEDSIKIINDICYNTFINNITKLIN